MNKTHLLYYHNRNIFLHDQFKPWIKKYCKDVRFEGFYGGYPYWPVIEISNWDEIKNSLPKSYKPIVTKDANDSTDIMEYLRLKQLEDDE